MTPMKEVKVLVVDDNALVLDLLLRGLAPHCDAHPVQLMAPMRCCRSWTIRRTLIVLRLPHKPGLDGRQL